MAEENFEPEEDFEEEEDGPDEFNWTAMVTPPWDPGTHYFFFMPKERLFEADEIGYRMEFARDFHFAMSHFCTAAAYTGLHRTIDRLTEEFVKEGEDEAVAALILTVAVQLVQQGIAEFLPDFVHEWMNAEAEDQKPAESFQHPTSPLHVWAFVQACDYLERDLLPIFENKDGEEDSYPFGDPAEIRAAIREVRKILTPEAEALLGEVNPYRQVADVRSLMGLIEELENENPDIDDQKLNN